jgi:hypothetical protein
LSNNHLYNNKHSRPQSIHLIKPQQNGTNGLIS